MCNNTWAAHVIAKMEYGDAYKGDHGHGGDIKADVWQRVVRH